MVLRVFANRGCWESSDDGVLEGDTNTNTNTNSGSGSGGFSVSNNHSNSRSGSSHTSYYSSSNSNSNSRNEIIPPPPNFPRPVIVFQPEQLPKRLDYSLRKEQVDRIRWPADKPKNSDHPNAFSRQRLIADILHGRYSPPRRPRKGTSSSSSSAPQDIHQRGLCAENFPIYNSENTAQWRHPIITSAAVYSDVLEQRTWISYGSQRKQQQQPRRRLRNYY